jgi:hypothetical protein
MLNFCSQDVGENRFKYGTQYNSLACIRNLCLKKAGLDGLLYRLSCLAVRDRPHMGPVGYAPAPSGWSCYLYTQPHAPEYLVSLLCHCGLLCFRSYSSGLLSCLVDIGFSQFVLPQGFAFLPELQQWCA